MNYKIAHDKYFQSIMEKNLSQCFMQYQSFVDVWHKCVPEIQFMTPLTYCMIFIQYVKNIVAAISEDEPVSWPS